MGPSDFTKLNCTQTAALILSSKSKILNEWKLRAKTNKPFDEKPGLPTHSASALYLKDLLPNLLEQFAELLSSIDLQAETQGNFSIPSDYKSYMLCQVIHEICILRSVLTETLEAGGALDALSYKTIHQLIDRGIYNLVAQFVASEKNGRTPSTSELALALEATDKIQTKVDLQASEERFRQLAESLSKQVVHIMDLNPHRITYVSPSYEKIWKQSISLLYENPYSFIERIHPEDRPKLAKVMQLQDEGVESSLEYRLLFEDGSIRWINDTSYPVKNADGIVYRGMGIAEDITERKLSEVELKRTSGILNSIMNASLDNIYVKDRNSRMVYCNPSARKLIGTPEDQIYGKTDTEFMGPGNGGEEIRAIDDQIMSTGTGNTSEEWVTWKDGSKRLYLSRKDPLRDLSGNVTGLIGISRDITDYKEIENARAQLLSLSHADIEKIREEKEVREKFVSTLTHDLRNPLTIARANAELLLNYPDKPEVQSRIATGIISSIDRADKMIRDLLDANRIRAGGKIPIQAGSCELRSLLEVIVEELSLLHGNRFLLKAEQEAHGFWDSQALRRVVENLATNAVKYGEAQGQVVLSLIKQGDSFKVCVQNIGNTLSTDELQYIFEPFRRSASAERGSQRGWGLGLTLVKGIVEAHGGTVTVESSALQGTIFSVTLPSDHRSQSR